MKASTGALLLALAAVRGAGVNARAVAEGLRRLAGTETTDDQIALQRYLCESAPDARDELNALAEECIFFPVRCPGCGTRLRAHSWQLDPAARCPVCSSFLLLLPNAAALVGLEVEARMAAESQAPYIAPRTASRLAHFELLRMLGSGGCGKVYAARNVRTDRVVALKLLEFLPLESRRGAFRRLVREVRFAARVEHPHVVPVRDVGFSDGVPYIEMELMPGGSLQEYVEQHGAVPWRQACGYVLQALSALSVSHKEGVIHRDLKPANILFDKGGHARLTDFGLSRFVNETTSTSVRGRFVGSPHFMAPEQWTGSEIGPRADIYAMGLIAYYIMTGRLPFEGESALALLYKHLHVPLPDPRATVSEIPVFVAQATQKAAAKNPNDRFGSAGEYTEALREGVDLQLEC